MIKRKANNELERAKRLNTPAKPMTAFSYAQIVRVFCYNDSNTATASLLLLR